jgi:hypothetical protein
MSENQRYRGAARRDNNIASRAHALVVADVANGDDLPGPCPETQAGRAACRGERGRRSQVRGLQRAKERDQVGLLAGGEADPEPLVVEVDGLAQVGRRAVVEVRRGRGTPDVEESTRGSGATEHGRRAGEERARLGIVIPNVFAVALRE